MPPLVRILAHGRLFECVLSSMKFIVIGGLNVCCHNYSMFGTLHNSLVSSNSHGGNLKAIYGHLANS